MPPPEPHPGHARHALVGAAVVFGDRLVDHHAVIVEDGMVVDVVPAGALPASLATHPLATHPPAGAILAPGFVDIHTHGAAGAGFNDGTAPAAATALAAMLRAGVTTVLPTLASAPLPDLATAIDAVCRVSAPDCARVAGVHLEGPYFSPAQAGAQDPRAFLHPSPGSLGRLLEQRDAIRMISFAPELPGTVWLTEQLVAHGIIAAAGHSDGTAADLARCQEVGLSHVIHIYSGQSSTRRDGPWRVPGMLEATLASEDLTVEMIADGKHLPVELMRIAHRCLGEHLCLVSDSTSGTGLPGGSRYRMGNLDYLVECGVGMTLDRTAFGGSTTFLSRMVPLVANRLGVTAAQAIAMATSAPARSAGLTDVGQIAPRSRADFVLLDSSLNVRNVALSGRWIGLDR